ncbi:hypothetical protein FBZ92_113142 [Nitrospirillum viridazoti]|uniref:ApeA N-terminal domain-containing protein n=1 Tax=Nitrospirillum amazonense TaxID=28077 RepID=A0A560IAS0_9PROT|nr:hypothetical protein FBZ92_113142 [Nitrospirillum amazonense]
MFQPNDGSSSLGSSSRCLREGKSTVSTDWWPASLAHIPRQDPWGDDDIVVAEITSFEDGSETGERMTISSLVPIPKLNALSKNFASLNFEVSTSGPRPSPSSVPYKPWFRVETHGDLSDQYEPLVLAWDSHNHTAFVPDPGFLMTYGLMPRPETDGGTHWDDLTGPVRGVVRVSKPSVYEFPNSSPASVTISKPYLQDYLSLRRMALVQSFWERRRSSPDDELEARLGDKTIVDLDTPGRRMRLFRPAGKPHTVTIEASGGRVVAMPGPFPISNAVSQAEGLTWPGIDGVVTHARAMSMSMEYVYVDDCILGDYEGRPEYRISPEIGAVGFGTQWSVGHCDRIGRDLIRVEIKKLYGGAPRAVIKRWHECAVRPPADTSYAANQRTQNIAKRAKALTYGLITLGERLAALSRTLNLRHLSADKFVTPRRRDLDYKGWWTFGDAEMIARNAPKNMTRDVFLERRLAIAKLLIEGLTERSLRATLHAAGASEQEIKDLRSLKLLDSIVRLCQVAHAAGLRFAPGDPTIWHRLATDGTTPEQPLQYLFALNDMRQLKAHRSEPAKFTSCLQRFDIDETETVAGHGLVLDRVYDRLITELDRINETIDAAVNQ